MAKAFLYGVNKKCQESDLSEVLPSGEFIEFGTDYQGSSSPSTHRFLTFLSGTPCSWDTPVVVNIYHKIEDIDTLIVTKTMSFDNFYIIRIPRSSGLLKITMSLVPDDSYEWAKFSGFYAKIKCPGYQTIVQLPALVGQEDFVLSYVDFDVFHVTFTSVGD